MGNVSRLKAVEADPPRTALAAAIKEAEKARQAVERQRGGIAKTRQAKYAADDAVEKAQAAVGKAKQGHAVALAHAAASETGAPSSGVPAARQAALEAEDHRDALRAAVAGMESAIPDWEAKAIDAGVAVEAAISAILTRFAEKLLERGRKIAAQLEPVRRALDALWADHPPAGHDAALAHERGRRPLKQTKEAVVVFLRSTSNVERGGPDPWMIARERLRKDAHAELPELDALLSGDV